MKNSKRILNFNMKWLGLHKTQYGCMWTTISFLSSPVWALVVKHNPDGTLWIHIGRAWHGSLC